MIQRKTFQGRCAITAGLVLLLAALPSVTSAEGESPLEKATGYYWDGLFDRAVAGLEELSTSLTGEDRIVAYEYLARSHVRLDQMEKGKDVFKELLRVRPSWRPDPGLVAGPEMSVFERALEEYENENLGGVNVRTEPTRANVFLDGDLQKEPTPLTIERVPAGDHALRVELDRFVAIDTVIVVNAGEVVELDLELAAAPDEGGPVPLWKKRWAQVAGGVLGLGLILAVAGGGGGDDGGLTGTDDLPFFPEPPHE